MPALDHLDSGSRLEQLDQLLMDAGDEVSTAELNAAKASVAYKVALAAETLKATGSVEIRKMTAIQATEGLYLESEIADAVLRGCRARMSLLEQRVSIGQSLSATARNRMP